MEHTSSKNFILWTIAIIVVIISIIGFSVAFFTYSRLSTTSSTLRLGQMMFGYLEETNGISLTNAFPIRDEDAFNTKDENAYFDFYITYNFPEASRLDYEIDIEDITHELEEVQVGTLQSIDSTRIKVALEKRKEVITDTEKDFVVSPVYFSEIEKTPAKNEKKGYKLYEKTTSGSSTDFYRLYVWIPEYDASGIGIPLIDIDSNLGIENQAFSVKINVQSNVEAN